MELTYRKEGDYFLPNLMLIAKNNGDVGKYGLLRVKYLKRHQKDFYLQLLVKNELTNHLVEIDKTARSRIDNIINSLAEKEGVNEELKATNQIKWVGLMNNFKFQAEELVLNELIYN